MSDGFCLTDVDEISEGGKGCLEGADVGARSRRRRATAGEKNFRLSGGVFSVRN